MTTRHNKKEFSQKRVITKNNHQVLNQTKELIRTNLNFKIERKGINIFDKLNGYSFFEVCDIEYKK